LNISSTYRILLAAGAIINVTKFIQLNTT